MTVIGTFGKSYNETIFKTVTEIWNCLDKSMDEFDGIHLYLVARLAIVLLDATQAIQNENVDICPVSKSHKRRKKNSFFLLRFIPKTFFPTDIIDVNVPGPTLGSLSTCQGVSLLERINGQLCKKWVRNDNSIGKALLHIARRL